MLSAHEIAALMVINACGPCDSLAPSDLTVLANWSLIDLNWGGAPGVAASITTEGRRRLEALATVKESSAGLDPPRPA